MKSKDYKNYQKVDDLKLIHSGQEYFDLLLKLIHEAQKTIYLNVYILDNDEIGNKIIIALINAREKGVLVYLTVDSYGSNNLRSTDLPEKLLKAGVNFRFFAPIFSIKGFGLGRRLHHKIAVFDDHIALVGGINIADRYYGTTKEGPWLDFAVYIKGDACLELSYICQKIWNRRFKKIQKDIKQKIQNTKLQNLIKITQNDYLRRKNQITNSYKNRFKNAEKNINILNAYFLPNIKIKNILKKASLNGVKIRLIVSLHSDEKLFKRATSYLYDWLLRNNIEVYEYKPSVVHGKVITVDDTWSTVGSHDLNFLSTYGSIEANIETIDPLFTEKINKEIEEIITKYSTKITIKKNLQKRSILDRLKNWSAYQILRISFLILFFLSSKRED